MEIEHDVKVIPIDDATKFQKEVEKLAADGWSTVPGIVPIAIYHVVRAKQAPADMYSGAARLIIDDTKIKILKPDGSLQ